MTTSANHSKTSTTHSKARDEYEAEMLSNEVYGAFLLALKARKAEENLTQAELGRRLGKDKTRTSKLLAKPQNWQISTIAQLAYALNLTVNFTLSDNVVSARRFTPSGVDHVTTEMVEQQVQELHNALFNISQTYSKLRPQAAARPGANMAPLPSVFAPTLQPALNIPTPILQTARTV